MICIIAQEFSDINVLLNRITVNDSFNSGVTTIYNCTYNDQELLVILSGYGKVNIGVSLSIVLQQYSISYVIIVGNCASLNYSNCKICDIAISGCSFEYDVCFTPIGYETSQVPGLGSEYYLASSELKNIAIQACCNLRYNYYVGRYATADRFLANNINANDLYQNYNADFVDAECGDIGQFCCVYNIPYVCVKGVSNYGNNCAVNEYFTYQSKMNERSSLVAFEMIKLLAT